MTIKATIKKLRAELATAVAQHKSIEGQKSPYDSVEIRALHLALAFSKNKPFALFNGNVYSVGAPEYRRDKSDFFQAKAILQAKKNLGLFDEVERYGRKTIEFQKNTPFDSWVEGATVQVEQAEAA